MKFYTLFSLNGTVLFDLVVFLRKFFKIVSTLLLIGFELIGLFCFFSEAIVSILMDLILVYLLYYIGFIASYSSGSGQGVERSDFTGFAILAITFRRNSSLCCKGEGSSTDSSVF